MPRTNGHIVEPLAADGSGTTSLLTHAELLRVATAGSVDDGKSTLIGRLLYDSKLILDDQLDALQRTSYLRGDDGVNLALLTDGLRAEREQGITIDVAYRYFATARRRFILADTPGHIQYTRNMVTGASTADVAMILIDARNGVVQQSRRHALIASLLRVPHILVAVNKMDLVDFDQGAYERIVQEFANFATKLEIGDLTFIPISALHGDNIVERSRRMPWYDGASLLHYLEHVHFSSDRDLINCRLPIQWVVRPNPNSNADYRGYGGPVIGGIFKPGDKVTVLPSNATSEIASIDTYDGPVQEAFAPMAVVVRLCDQLDLSRGDMICRPGNMPTVGSEIEAMVCWMSDRPLTPGARYVMKHTTRWLNATVTDLAYRLDIDTLHRDVEAPRLDLNEVGRISLRTAGPLFFDEYRKNRATGSFILIDSSTNATVAAGMILAPSR